MSDHWTEEHDLELQQLEAEMREDLHAVRTSAAVYAERAWNRGARRVPQRSATRAGWFAWSASGALAAVLAVGGVHLLHRNAASTPAHIDIASQASRGNNAVSDEALLQQLQTDLSSGVPEAMRPLDSNDSRSTGSSTQRSE